MPTYILDIDGYKPIMGMLDVEPVIEPLQLYRRPHDVEIVNYDLSNKFQGRVYRGDGHWDGPVRGVVRDSGKALPEVYRILPDQVTPLYDRWIHLWRDLNPDLDDNHFCTLLGNNLWLTNGTGWPGRRNVILGQDLDAAFPAFHAPITTGGSVHKGIEKDGNLQIESLLVDQPTPTVEYVLARPWLWFWGTAVTTSGRVNMITRKNRSGVYIPVRVPFITSQPVYLPLNQLDKLEPGYVPPYANKLAMADGSVTGSK